MAWKSSPTAVIAGPEPPSERARSTCSPLTSWYSSISTWSNAAASRGPITSSRGQRAPEQQQVVEVDHAELPLARRVGLEQRRDRLAVLRAPREVLLDHARQRLLRVDRARVDVQQRALLREPRPAPARARARRAAGPARPRRRPRRARRSRPAARAPRRGGAPAGARPSGTSRRARATRPGTSPRARCSISRDARRVNVSSRIRSDGTPSLTSHATRAHSVVVLPVPAPARISSGPPACVAAARCSSLSSSSQGRSPVSAHDRHGPRTLRTGSDDSR